MLGASLTTKSFATASRKPRVSARQDTVEIIGGLKKQDFLVAQGKNIVPTEAGLTLHGILKLADPTLVDPGITAHSSPAR